MVLQLQRCSAPQQHRLVIQQTILDCNDADAKCSSTRLYYVDNCMMDMVLLLQHAILFNCNWLAIQQTTRIATMQMQVFINRRCIMQIMIMTALVQQQAKCFALRLRRWLCNKQYRLQRCRCKRVHQPQMYYVNNDHDGWFFATASALRQRRWLCNKQRRP